MSEISEFQAAIKENVQASLERGCDAFQVMQVLDCAKLDIYMILRAQQQQPVKRSDIVRSNILPPNGIKLPQQRPPNGHQ